MKGGVPHLEEIGPYIYRAYSVKFNISWEYDRFQKQILKYKQCDYYVYDKALSGPHLDPDRDVIVTPNLGFFGIHWAVKDELQCTSTTSLWNSQTGNASIG